MLIVFISSLVGVTGYSLFKESDNVTFTAIDEWGDKSLLDGVTAQMNFSHHDQLNWEVSFSPNGETETAYEYNTFYDRYVNFEPRYGIEDVFFSTLDLKKQHPDITKLYEELEQDAKNPGEIRRATLKFKDYFEYYPVNFSLELPGISVIWEWPSRYEQHGEYSYSGITPARGKEMLKVFNDYFKIPVHDKDVREITVHASDNGFSYGSSYISTFDYAFFDVVFSDCLYFTFNNEVSTNHDFERELVDTSLIPGGYGIYSLPYNESEVRYNELKTVYGIPSDATVEVLFCDEERNELYLVLHENDKAILHIIDTVTMTDKTVIRLFDFAYEDNVYVKQYDDFFVFIKNSVDFNVVQRNADGTYKSALTGAMPPETVADRDYFSYNACFGFDGERLVVLTVEGPGAEEISILSIQPDIMVFTKDGLSYYCKWLCSLGEPMSNWRQFFVYRDGVCKVTIE